MGVITCPEVERRISRRLRKRSSLSAAIAAPFDASSTNRLQIVREARRSVRKVRTSRDLKSKSTASATVAATSDTTSR